MVSALVFVVWVGATVDFKFPGEELWLLADETGIWVGDAELPGCSGNEAETMVVLEGPGRAEFVG